MTNTNVAPLEESDEIDLIALFSLVWRNKWWVIASAVICIFLAGFYATRIAVPMYPATATIALETEGQQLIGDIESIFAGGGTDTSAINTEIEVMRSRAVIGRLVDDLSLVEDPEFNSALRPLSPIQRFRLRLSGRERVMPSETAMRNRVIDALISRIGVSNIRQSFAFTLSIQTTDPEKSAIIVNRLADIYINNQVQQKLDETTRAIEFLSRRTTELQANVVTLEQDLAQRMEESDVVDASLLQAQNLQLRDLRSRVDDAQLRLDEDVAIRDALQAATDRDEAFDVLEAIDDPRFAGVVQRYRAGRLSDEAADAALDGIAGDLDDAITRSQLQFNSLQDSALELSAQISAQSEELIQIQQIEREADAARLLAQTFLTRLQEASVQQGLETADARVLSLAVERGATSPRMMRLLALGGILGTLLGVAFIFIREWQFAGFRTIDELHASTGLTVMGSLPAMSANSRKGVLESLKSRSNSVFAEAVRNLRTSILMANPDKEPQVILVTSSIPGEGKTTLALALARYFGSLEGRRVLLVEADIRRQTLRAYIDESRPKGVALLDVLLGASQLEDLDLMDPDLGIEVLMGSGGEFNAADLFESRRFGDLIAKLRTRYDQIIIDSAPVLAVPDARVLARYADLSVFAVRWSSTTRGQTKQGLEMLRSVGKEADGVVLTQVDTRKMKGYGYGGQYGYDGYASGYYAKD